MSANEQLYKLVPNSPKIFNVDCSERQLAFTKSWINSRESAHLDNISFPSLQNKITIAMLCCPSSVTCCTSVRNNRPSFWLNIPHCALSSIIMKCKHGSSIINHLLVFLTDRPILCSNNFYINYDSDYDIESVTCSNGSVRCISVNSNTLMPLLVETNLRISYITVYNPIPIICSVSIIISVLFCCP
jgi:hypothetical protein